VGNRVLRLVVGGVALAALIGGCGGSGDDELTKAELIKQGDEICKEVAVVKADGIQAVVANAEKDGEFDTAEAREFLTGTYFPDLETMVGELEEFSAPAAEEAQVAAIGKSFKAEVAKAEAKPSYGLGPEFLDKPHALAKRYGFKVCSEV